MKSNDEAQSEALSVEQLLDHLVQGVQEIPQLPKVDINDHEGIKKSMEHYYSERAKWIELTSAKINRLIVEAVQTNIDLVRNALDVHYEGEYHELRKAVLDPLFEHKAQLSNNLSKGDGNG